MSEEIVVEVYVRTNIQGSAVKERFTIEREEWESFSELEKDEYAQDFLSGMYEWGYNEIDADGEAV